MGEFWRAREAGEQSERLLQLTTRIIDTCEGHYTVWQYRRRLVDVLHVDLHGELAFVRQYTVERPKNYQLWRHREAIIARLLESRDEGNLRPFIEAEREDLCLVLMDEPKNYHAWQYRQWLTRQVPAAMVDGELEFTKDMLLADPFNNSAWNHRFFILNFLKANNGTAAKLHWDGEVELISRLLRPAEDAHIENQSILNYCHSLPLLYAPPSMAAVRSTMRDLLTRSFPWHHHLYQKLFLVRE